jgi:dephospho-CoA kinase
MDKNLLNIALTGSRCSGKDGIAKLFRQIGVPVFDADSIIKYILNYRKSMPESVRKAFGREYVFGEYINPIAFDTDDKFESLIELVEFEIFESYSRFRKKYKDKQYTIFHSSLIFEKNWSKKFDRVITVFTPKQERMERYKALTGDNLQTIHAIFGHEINEIQKNQSSDFIIHNYQEAADVLKQVQNIDNRIVDYYIELNKKRELESSPFYSQSLYKNILSY